MKFLIVLSAVVAVAFAAPQKSDDPAQAVIVKQSSDSDPSGAYVYSYETGNGISAQEAGSPQPLAENGAPVVVAQGSYRYQGDDGQTYEVSYVADQNGFQPQGAHLPQAPPVPEAIQKALEYIARNPPKPDQ